MSSSTFNIVEPDSNDSITLVVGPDGTVSPDQETVKSFLSSRSTVDINLMTMKKVEAGKVNVTLDNLTFVNSDSVEDPQEMDRIARNLMNFRMDHDYTPLTSPTHRPASMQEVDDELAQTLSMLEEGSLNPQTHPEPLTKITKIVKGKKQTMFVNNKQKAKMISTGLLKEKPSDEVFKKPKPVQIVKTIKVKTPVKIIPKQEEEEEEDEVEDEEEEEYLDDENDEDFELDEELRPKILKRPVKKTKLKVLKPVVKIDKTKQLKTTPQKNITEKIEAEVSKTSPPATTTEKIAPKIPDKKQQTPKKEKKSPKPLPDDFALFSTPDIIRRVGKEPTSPEKPQIPKPAKISPESRSKSNVDIKPKRLSTDSKIGDKIPEKTRRQSLDSKKQEYRRFSLESKHIPESKSDEQVSVQEFTENLSNESEPIGQLEPLPSAEDIRAIIQSENTKSFTTSLIIPEGNELSAEEQTAQINIESGGLDLDQSILDNINSDLISEDILYQVAQSLADNTELQNAIDKSIVDGNLVLDPTIQQTFADQGLVQNIDNSNVQLQQGVHASGDDELDVKPGTQIVRSDGRVVVIPPIERPTTRSRNRKKESSPVRQPKPAIKPLDDEHVSGNELDSSEEEEEEESEDDPNKLWCICNQPHNNRFMICCDTCEEWYHGKCVNVTKAMGQMMEQQGKEWICIFCKDSSLKRPKAAARRIRKASKTSTDSGSSPTKKIASSTPTSPTINEEKKTSTGCVVCGKPSRANSIYCSDNCILKHAQGVEKVVVSDKKVIKTLNSNSIDKREHAKPSPKTPLKQNLTQSKLKLVKNVNNDGVSLAVQKKGVNVGVLEHSPKEPPIILNKKITGLKIVSKQVNMNQQQKVIKVISPVPVTNPRPTLTSTPAKKVVQTKLPVTPISKDKQPMPQKTPKARQAEIGGQPKQENLRDTVRKTFFEQLSNRLKKVDDLTLSDDDLKGISNEIESQLYKCFGDTGQKYRNKYRSLIFNIKDTKNQTLWRRICEKAVNPYQLVRLSPDDLASQELASWREREAKHQLDMIKKSELELLNCNRQYVFKTHKGEQIFEDDRPKDQVTEVISGLGADNTIIKEDTDENKDKDKKLKHNKKDRSRDRSRSKRSRDKSKERRKDSRSSSKEHKKRSHSKEHARHEKKRSRSKDHHRERERRSSHKSSRHKIDDKSITTDKLDKRSKEILEQLVDKHIVPPLEDKMWKNVPQEEEVQSSTAPIESDSDHEPSSTVTIPTPPRSTEVDDTIQLKKTSKSSEQKDGKEQANKQSQLDKAPFWKGTINMVDVAQISIMAHEVSGDCQGLAEELPNSFDIVGRISPDTVWDYIGKMKSSNSKTISLIRLTATNAEEKMPYLALYSYLSSRNRLGVIKTLTKAVKDFYILPLAGHSPIPEALLPITGPGFEETRPQLLLGVIVRDKRKRGYEASSVTSHSHAKRSRIDLHSNVSNTPPSTSRSYTPPPAKEPRAKITAVPLPVSSDITEDEPEDDMDEPYSPEDSDPDTVPETSTSRLNKQDISGILSGGVKTSSFLETGLATQTFEPFSNKFDSIPGLDDATHLPATSIELQRKMAELDQRIAAQKAEIDKVSQDLVSSAASASEIGSSTLANIALPSDLQQILESIKTIGAKTQTGETKIDSTNSPNSSGNDLTIPLLLPKLSSRPLVGAAAKSETTIPLNLPKSKKSEEKSSGSVLSSLSEEDLIKKAAEMLGETEPQKKDGSYYNSPKRARLELSQPPIPGLEDE